MRYPALLLLIGPLLGCSVPFVGGPSANERKAPCDRIAAQAIQTDDFDEARTLAAQASECYANARRGA